LEPTVSDIKILRDQTGAGIMDCKNALRDAEGDIDKAAEILKQKGIDTATKKSSRDTSEGVVDSYIHSGDRIGALVEINCETDFVARTTEVKELAHNLAMQIAAMSPLCVSKEDIPEGNDSPSKDICLVEQLYIKDPSITIGEMVRETIARVGENIRVRRFSRFAIGE